MDERLWWFRPIQLAVSMRQRRWSFCTGGGYAYLLALTIA